jgi:hypothetical protein
MVIGVVEVGLVGVVEVGLAVTLTLGNSNANTVKNIWQREQANGSEESCI